MNNLNYQFDEEQEFFVDLKGEEMYHTDVVETLNALLAVVPEPPPKHEPDFKGVPCPYGRSVYHNECDCGYWGKLEKWANSIEEALAVLPEHLK